MSRMARKLSILVAAMMVGGMMMGLTPIAMANDDEEESGPAGLGLCIAGLLDCDGDDGTESEEDEDDE